MSDNNLVLSKSASDNLCLFVSCLNVLNSAEAMLIFNDNRDIADRELIGASFREVLNQQYEAQDKIYSGSFTSYQKRIAEEGYNGKDMEAYLRYLLHKGLIKRYTWRSWNNTVTCRFKICQMQQGKFILSFVSEHVTNVLYRYRYQ